MDREKRQPDDDQTHEIEKTVDPYTGELVPVPEDADQFIEVVPEETKDRRGSNYILREETGFDSFAANEDADAATEQAAHYTEDPDIKEDFAERQRLANGGREALLEDLEQHNSLSPRLTGGDIDAAWQDADVAGEEAVGGSVSTPDQDVVEEFGEGAGLTYKDDEPLDYDKKVLDRDRRRWELNPASAETQYDELENEQDDPDDGDDVVEEVIGLGELEDEEEEGADEDEDLEENEELDEEDLDDLLELDEDNEDEEEDDDLEEDIDALDPELEDDEDDILDAEFDDSEDEDD